MLRRFLVPLLVLAVLAPAAAGAQQPPACRQALALYDPDSGALRYRGARSETRGEGLWRRATVFTTPAGRPIVEEEVVYQPGPLAVRAYRLRDRRTGREETLRREAGRVIMTARVRAGEEPEQDRVDWEQGGLVGLLLAPFMRARWAQATAGEPLVFPLYVPGRQDVFTFRLQPVREAPIAGPERVVIRVEPDSWFVRQLVKPLFFAFAAEPPHLLVAYLGRVPITDPDGDPQRLRVEYHYEGDCN